MTRHFTPLRHALFEDAPEEKSAKDEVYVRVDVRLVRRTKDAILVSRADCIDHQGWIPRSLIHGADETELDSRRIGAPLSLRIFEWKAKQCRFVK